MADRAKAVRRGGRYCVAGAPNNESCKNTMFTPGIKMHQFPRDPVVRAKWVKFVLRHRCDFSDPVSKYASLCSAHFEERCYSRNQSILEGMEGLKMHRVLTKGSVPTRHTVVPPAPEVLPDRSKRQVNGRLYYLYSSSILNHN